jgi:hypothetical protein
MEYKAVDTLGVNKDIECIKYIYIYTNCSKVWSNLEMSLFLKEKHIFGPLK